MPERQLIETTSIYGISDGNKTSRAFAEAKRAIESILGKDDLPGLAKIILEIRMKEFNDLCEQYRRPIEFPRDLNVEFSRQVYKYVDLGFNEILGMTKEEYVNSFPLFRPQPAEYQSLKLNFPVLVDPRIKVKTYASCPVPPYNKNGFLYSMGDAVLSNVDDGHKYPYYCWVQDGSKYRGVNWKAQEIVDQLEKPEVETNLLESLSSIIMFPEMIRNGEIDVSGSRINGRIINLSLREEDKGSEAAILFSNGAANPEVGLHTKGQEVIEKAPVFIS